MAIPRIVDPEKRGRPLRRTANVARCKAALTVVWVVSLMPLLLTPVLPQARWAAVWFAAFIAQNAVYIAMFLAWPADDADPDAPAEGGER